MSRPSKYTAKLAADICQRIAEGLPLTEICKDPDVPAYGTVLRWRAENPEFREMYALAREDQADTLADQILTISDDDSLDIGFDDEGRPFVKGENIQRARLRVDSRKWLAAKMKPRIYSEKFAVGGADDLPPVRTNATVTYSPEESYRRMLDGAPE